MPARLDWFKFYPSDFLNSPDVMMMTPSARGCYITLLGRCWLNAKNGGGIPNKTDYILSVCNCSAEEWDSVKNIVLSKFEKKDGQLFNPRLMEEILEVKDLSDTKRENAQSGWENRRIANEMHPHSIRNTNADGLHAYIDKEKDIDADKDKIGDFRTISIAYRRAMGKSSGKDKRVKQQYAEICQHYGESAVLKAFEEWVELNQWKDNKPALYFFFQDAGDLIEESAAVQKMETAAQEPAADVSAAIEAGNAAGRAEYERRQAEIEQEEEEIKKLKESDVLC